MLEQLSASVGLCTYNAKRHLTKQLDSILQQTLPVTEIVVIDDVSTDGTQEILSAYNERYPGIFRLIFNKENKGAKKNFEQLLQLCGGEVIFFSDHDDIWMPHKVAATLAHFEANPADQAVFSNGVLIDDNDQRIPGCLWSVNRFTEESRRTAGTQFDLLRYLLRHERMVTGATLAVRKNFVPKLLPFKMMKRMWHDAWIAFAAASHGALNYIEDELISYRIHASQQVGCGTKLKRLHAGEDMVTPTMRRELHRASTTQDLVNLVHARRKRVVLCRRLSRHLPIPRHIAQELRDERRQAEQAFTEQRSFVNRWKETLAIRMFNRWPETAKM
ncbi:glycosyltransferase [Chitinophaga horti]|uniref:Glycosyltransferase n=1 Tax=Chitinophaga horti TaxID=2920382 RepID=A0ABY6J6K3_9BACT|nr:glycosyltransferase [Chitinophaga horti]UYQ93929.1 glycosyltransferase [Chitinophaga horti]